VTVRRRTALVLASLAVLGAAGTASAMLPEPLVGGPAPLAAAVVVQPAAVVTAEDVSSDTAARYGSRIRAALADPGAVTVAGVVEVEGLGQVFRQDADHALPPASTQKSFTGLAALLSLPQGMRYTTEVAARAKPSGGRLPGSLWLVAGGDPYLSRTGLRALAHSVRARGITYVTGDLLLDDSRYDARRRAAGWKSDYVPDESGPLSALAVDRNAYRHDAAFVSDPALPNARLFRDYLAAEGVTVHGVTKRYRRTSDAWTVASRESGPIADVLRRALKASDNFAAEMVLKVVGRTVRGQGSSYAGHAAVVQVLKAQGVEAGTGTDGSGLSSYNRQTPAAQVELLHVAEQSPTAGAAFRRALPIACHDGTLKTRMCNTPAALHLSAKTGTLPGVRALSGYTRTASGREVWFSFQLTGVRNGTKARDAIDRAAVFLASATE
jgi:D-alanyl-D-alanine carboxypeptidase/D-alanyl-D-alanine-endopeptidase (penicillin-binding protein 4)